VPLGQSTPTSSPARQLGPASPGLKAHARSRGGMLLGGADAGGRSIRWFPPMRWGQDRSRSSTGEGGVDFGGSGAEGLTGKGLPRQRHSTECA
jgi:hypothetical protein